MTEPVDLRERGGFLKGTTSLVVLHFLAALLLAMCPAAHERVHHHQQDAAQEGCVVTQLAQGICEEGFAVLQSPTPGLRCFFLLIPSVVTAPAELALDGQAQGRAPPV